MFANRSEFILISYTDVVQSVTYSGLSLCEQHRNERNSSHLALPTFFLTHFVKNISFSSLNFSGEKHNLDLPPSSVLEL